MICLSGMEPQEIAGRLELKPFQGAQIFKWIHEKQVFEFDAMTNLSKDLRTKLAESYAATQLTLLDMRSSVSAPGTRKALFRLSDGETVESVLIRDQERVTICLSTQVGCAIKCAFCATGLSGFTRNLGPGEIVEQALYLIQGEDLDGRSPNIVFMGMGEPFRNYDATLASVKLLQHKQGLNIGARKITVSTAGEVSGIRRFADEDTQVRLSISLHAANDTLRSKLVPLNRKYPLSELANSIRYYLDRTGRQVTFEWTLIDGVNDSPENAKELARFVQPLKAIVNLIPLNAVEGLEFRRPSDERCERFQQILERQGVRSTLRRERGGDINAACGQLRRSTPVEHG